MAKNWENAISNFMENLNSGPSYFITTVNWLHLMVRILIFATIFSDQTIMHWTLEIWVVSILSAFCLFFGRSYSLTIFFLRLTDLKYWKESSSIHIFFRYHKIFRQLLITSQKLLLTTSSEQCTQPNSLLWPYSSIALGCLRNMLIMDKISKTFFVSNLYLLCHVSQKNKCWTAFLSYLMLFKRLNSYFNNIDVINTANKIKKETQILCIEKSIYH